MPLRRIRTADITMITGSQSIRCQKANTRAEAIDKWVERWHQSPRTAAASAAYQTALTRPPDGKPHTTFQRAPERSRGSPRRPHRRPTQTTAKSGFWRRTISTLYHFITGHAFVGAFTQRFFPQHTPEQVACQWGEPIPTIEHVLRDCPRYDAVPKAPNSTHGQRIS